MSVFQEQVEANHQANLIIANGVPRYHERLPAFREVVRALQAHVLAVCLIDISDETARERSASRARPGDDFETRLAGYYAETEPVIDALASEYPYVLLDGTLDPTRNAQRLLDVYLDPIDQ